MSEPLWLWLYNARTVEEVAQRMLEQAGGECQEDEGCRARAGTWARSMEQEWRRYRRVVERWVDDAVTDEDWRHVARWTGGHRVMTVLFARTPVVRFNLGLWLYRGVEGTKGELLVEAYLQVLEHMLRARQGTAWPPRWCEACRRVFLPVKTAQRWCSVTCANRMLQRRWRARHAASDGGDGLREKAEGRR